MVEEVLSDEEKFNHVLWEFFLEDVTGIAHMQRMVNECDDELRKRREHKKMKACWRFDQ